MGIEDGERRRGRGNMERGRGRGRDEQTSVVQNRREQSIVMDMTWHKNT